MSDARAVVADRSATVRSLLTRLLQEDGDIVVVGEAADGRETLALARSRAPDAVVLDLDLPSLDGRDLVAAIASETRVPMIVLTPALHRERTRTAFASLSRGVVDVLPKPGVPHEWTQLGCSLRDAVRHLAERSTLSGELDPPTSSRAAPCLTRAVRYLAIGASTGGPGALYELLVPLGRRPRVAVAVVQHIAEGFEVVLAEWLALELGLDIAVARAGERLERGMVRIAPAGAHLTIDPYGTLLVDRRKPPENGHRPSVDVLFASLLEHSPERVAAVLLSGMGTDGAEGMLALSEAGCLTMAQDERSSTVYGMPRAAVERGAALVVLPPAEIGRLVARATGRER